MTDKQEWEGAFNEKFHKIEVFYDVVANAPYPMIMPKDRHENDEYGLEDIKSFIHQTLQQERQRWVAELEGKKKTFAIIITKDDKEAMLPKEWGMKGFNQGLQTAIDTINKNKETK